MLNKKGVISEFGESVFGIILYTVLIFVVLMFAGSSSFKVNATVEADNAAFTCNNNLINLLQFKTTAADGTATTFSTLLLQALYSSEAEEHFKSKTVELLDKSLGRTRWSMDGFFGATRMFESDNPDDLQNGIHGAGGRPIKNIEACEAYVPVPCSEENCVILLELAMEY